MQMPVAQCEAHGFAKSAVPSIPVISGRRHDNQPAVPKRRDLGVVGCLPGMQDAIGPTARRKSKRRDQATRLKIVLHQGMGGDADAERGRRGIRSISYTDHLLHRSTPRLRAPKAAIAAPADEQRMRGVSASSAVAPYRKNSRIFARS
jgi:hypothetical protein